MGWSFEQERDAATFLRAITLHTNFTLRRDRELNHVETQLAKSQAGLTGEGDVQTFSYQVKDVRLLGLPGFPIKQAVDRRFINGMEKVSKALRRSNGANDRRIP